MRTIVLLKLLFYFGVVVVALVALSCDGGGTPVAVSCPPINGTDTARISDDPAYPNDGSSIEVFANANAYRSDGTAWCAANLSELQIELVAINTATCPYNCLAAVNISPDDIRIPKNENIESVRPLLDYDLNEHPPTKSPNQCADNADCYAIYQLDQNWTWCPQADYDPDGWCFVGDADLVSVGGEDHAQGNVHHFSIFALVELPQPITIEPPRTMELVVVSEFDQTGPDTVMVETEVRFDSENQFDRDKSQHLIRFFKVDQKGLLEKVIPECEGVQNSLDQLLTCLFPPGSKIKLGLNELSGGVQVQVVSEDRGIDVQFWTVNVEIY